MKDDEKRTNGHSNVCCRFKNRLRPDATRIKTYIESDHLNRLLFRCNYCACLFIHEFYEFIYYDDRDDRCYSTDVHVSDEQDADRLAALDPLSFISEAKKRPHLID